MSRSIRNRHEKNGVYLKICGISDKKDKITANRKFRRKEREEARRTLIEEEDNFETTDIKDVSNIWNFRSDGGAHYIGFNQFKKWRRPIEKEEQYRYRKK